MKKRTKHQISLTVVIPVFNEGERLFRAFGALDVLRLPKQIALKEVRFVNDGSSDNTLALLTEFQKTWNSRVDKPFTVHIKTYSANRGRGYAVRTGLKGMRTDYAVFMDGDMSIPLSNLKRFVPYMQQGVDVLAGSKKKPGAVAKPQRSWLRQIAGYGHTALASLILGVFYWDFQGGFKLFSKRFVQETLPHLSMDRWGFDMEVLYVARKWGYKSIELPVIWASIEAGSTVKLARDSYRAIKDMFTIPYLHFGNTLKRGWIWSLGKTFATVIGGVWLWSSRS
jgi:dolichyl-phosphate beta-glucosyltransferase